MANAGFLPQPVQISSNFDKVKKAEFFLVEKRENIFQPTDDDTLEDYLVRELKRKSKISKDFAQSIINVLKCRASFIPSVSWAYALAYLLGNSKVINLTVEYDWLHYSDFCEHGLLEYWEMANSQPETTFILVFQNINIIPSECSLLPFLEILSGVRPVLEGTKSGIPSNLYCLATVCSLTGDHAMGIPLKKELFQSWGAFISGAYPGIIDYQSLEQIDVYISPKMLKESLFDVMDSDSQTAIERNKATYYVG
jgi:hypothetical protein